MLFWVATLLVALLTAGQENAGPIVFRDAWRIASPSGSARCSVEMTSVSTNMKLDSGCSIERTLFGEELHPSYYQFLANEHNNCRKQAFFKISMIAKYVVNTKDLFASGRKINDNKHFEVSLGDKSILNISVPIEISTFNDRTLEMYHPYFNWTKAYGIFQRFPVSDDPPAVVSIRNVHNDTNVGLDGYLEVKDWKLEYVPHPDKWDFGSNRLSDIVGDDNDPLNACALLGSSHALVLNRVSIDGTINLGHVSSSGTIEVALPRVFCGIYTIQKYHDNVIVR